MCEIFRRHRTEFLKIYRRLPEIFEVFERLSKIAEDFRRLPKIAEDFPTTSEDNQRCRKIFYALQNQARQQFPRDFPPISSIIKEFRRCCEDSTNFFKQLLLPLPVRREKLDALDHNFRSAGARLAHNAWEFAGILTNIIVSCQVRIVSRKANMQRRWITQLHDTTHPWRYTSMNITVNVHFCSCLLSGLAFV